MTDRIAAVITVTAKQWNVPGLEPGFCWRKYGACTHAPAAVRTTADLGINRPSPGKARHAGHARRPEVAAV